MWASASSFNHGNYFCISSAPRKMHGTSQTTDCCRLSTDLTKVLRMARRGVMFAILQQFGCSDMLLSIISGCHNQIQASVRYNGSNWKIFPSERGGVRSRACTVCKSLFGDSSCPSIHFWRFAKLTQLWKAVRSIPFSIPFYVSWMFMRGLRYADDALFVAAVLQMHKCSAIGLQQPTLNLAWR